MTLCPLSYWPAVVGQEGFEPPTFMSKKFVSFRRWIRVFRKCLRQLVFASLWKPEELAREPRQSASGDHRCRPEQASRSSGSAFSSTSSSSRPPRLSPDLRYAQFRPICKKKNSG